MQKPAPPSQRGYLWSLLVAVLLFFALVSGVLTGARQLCHGHLGYPMDDTYIHMAIAKNFILHDVWGVTPYGFSSSTSSPFYTLLLAGTYFLSGIHESTPLVLNLGASILLLTTAAFVLKHAGLSPRWTLAALVGMVLLIPLPALAEGGMEHVFHALFTVWFVHLSAIALIGPHPKWVTTALLALSPILVMTRYEGLFLICVASVLFAAERKWAVAAGLIGGAAAPVAIYGAISVAHGWLALPNSVVLKANVPSHAGLAARLQIFWNWTRAMAAAPHVAFLFFFALTLLYLTVRARRTIRTYSAVMLTEFIFICFFHLDLARTGWFYRYEAYLIAVGIIVCAAALRELPPATSPAVLRFGLACAFVAFALLFFKGVRSVIYAPRAFHNIYEQQYQTARFVSQYYPRDTIVLNDIGAVCFYTDARVLDVFGLGSMEAARAKLNGQYNTAWLRDWASKAHAKVAVLYSTGWPGESFAIPGEWPKVARWTVSDNFVLGGDSVDIFALQNVALPAVRETVREFSANLPPEVKQSDAWQRASAARFGAK